MNIRLKATRYIWTAYTLAMLVVFASTSINNMSLGVGHVVIVIAMSIMAFLSTCAVWNWGDVRGEAAFEESETTKLKNNAKLDKLVARLSEEERDALRERLADDMAQYGVSDDGELVQYQTKARR